MDYQRIIDLIYKEVSAMEDPGQLANYIPKLAEVNPNQFGIHVSTLEGMKYGAGDYQQKFSIQSISKVLSLSMIYNKLDAHVWDRVGVEPSGRAFNSLSQLEDEVGIPRNPLINAGAMVICDLIISHFENPEDDLLEFVRSASRNSTITFNPEIASSEKKVGFRNRAMVNLMRSFGNIRNDTEQVLDLYFSLCSIEMTCEELSRTFLYLANDGKDPFSGNELLNLSQSKRVNAIMMTCGFYDEAGEFTFRVGLPGKSGVGGGIVAVHPDDYAIAVWSPRLNEKGNSFKGTKFLEMFTTETGQSIL